MTPEQIVATVGSIVTAASVICSLLPPGKPGSTLATVNRVLDILAINLGHAKS